MPILTGWLSWWMIALAAGALFFPLFHRILPTAFAWGFSRFAAPYLITWVALAPGVYAPLKIPVGAVVVIGAVLGALCWATFMLKNWQLTQQQLQEIFFTEITFGSFFLVVSLLLALNGTLLGNDDMRDTSIWTSLWMDTKFPAEDPWLAGNTLRYYILGLYPLLFLGKLSAAGPLESYNLGLAFTLANYFLLVSLCLKAMGVARWLAIGGAAVATLGCNLQSALQVARKILFGEPFNSTAAFMIDEGSNYAVYSPLLAFSWHALHPDYIAFPFFAAIIALCLATIYSKDPQRWNIQALLGGFFVSWIWGTNTWNVPSALLMLLAVRVLFEGKKSSIKAAFLDWKWSVTLVVSTLFFSWPSFQLSAGTPTQFIFGLSHTPAIALLRHWGLWLAPLLVLGLTASGYRTRWILALVLITIVGLNIAAAWIFIAVGAAALHLLFREKSLSERERVILFTVLVAVVLASVPEWIHLSEKWGRFNTVLKFNGPGWALFAIASMGACWNLRDRMAHGVWIASLALLVALQSSFLVYSNAKLWRERGPVSIDSKHRVEQLYPADRELIAKWTGIESAQLASHQILEASGTEYSPKMFGRISALSGAKSFLLFHDHQHQWLLYGGKPEIDLRKQVVAKIYGGEYSTCEELKQLLQTNGITAVITGQLERETYEPKNIQKLQSCL
jgi:uncharacterized membrane protein